jgi:hypothetical protein
VSIGAGDEDDDRGELTRELEQMAQTMRNRDWAVRLIELDRLVARHGLVALYDLGRIVGGIQTTEATALAVGDGWDPETALRSRYGFPKRKTGEP